MSRTSKVAIGPLVALYSLSTDVLGRVVEIVAGKPLGEVLSERVYRPLKMTDTTFVVPADKRSRVAQGLPTHPDTGAEFKLPDPTVPRKFDCGGGCAVSTAGDYTRFAQMLLHRGSLDGARVLSPRTVEFMTADQLGTISRGSFATSPGYTWGLGVAVRQDKGLAPFPGSPGDFYWPGAYATYWWADPKEELVVVFMTQSMFIVHRGFLNPGGMRIRHPILDSAETRYVAMAGNGAHGPFLLFVRRGSRLDVKHPQLLAAPGNRTDLTFRR